MEKAFVLFIALLVNNLVAFAGVTIYKTYEDYLKDEGVKYSHFSGDMHTTGHYTLFFKDVNGKKKRVKCKNIWGFKQDGKIFRVLDASPMLLVDSGKICYYEDGIAHLNMLRFNDTVALVGSGEIQALSASIGDPMYPINFWMGKPSKKMKPLLEGHP